MRSLAGLLLAVPALLPYSAAQADTSLSVPAFSLGISSYESFFYYSPPPADVPPSISVRSSSQTSTVISLDSFEETLQFEVHGTSSMHPGYLKSTMNLQSNAGYLITGVMFSASVYGVFTPPEVPSFATNVEYGGHHDVAWGGAAISAPGSTVVVPEMYQVTNFWTPVGVSASVFNTAGLGNFDLSLEMWGSVGAGRTYWQAAGIPDVEYKSYGQTEMYYVNPTLTVYTATLPVPEPGTWAMMVAGLLLIGASRRRS
ncbi:PEP-CTERM sorting domain-containing protein [Pseudoduganella lutea]|uniref:PEP-CTERM sorting domain-containing protein n=1 Tax=Pseudoduganella lutea TaxID=321985 RepID=A0A4P6KUM3_9BURK|nr:PEP-CTERM sorting domain-containing protein [Pseudoduganella lutea]QBE62536.1 PEP-CTERM sorting domain-containing protein [Pseudoduganella lutea]